LASVVAVSGVRHPNASATAADRGSSKSERIDAEHSHASEGGRHDAGAAIGGSGSFSASTSTPPPSTEESNRLNRGGDASLFASSPSDGAFFTGAQMTRRSFSTNVWWSIFVGS
jgi:hypothetical protein